MIDYRSTAIIIFAYNRPSHLKRVLFALEDYGIKIFFIHLDGPKNKKDKIIQKEILFTINSIKFANAKLISNKINNGLAKSIINGVSKILSQYENVIILEDDCIPFKNFFSFISNQLENNYFKMNCGAICSYMFPEISEQNSNILYPMTLKYFVPWGWATNKENWKKFIENKKKNLISYEKKTLYSKILRKINKKNIWSIDFIYNNLKESKNFIYPNFSLIKNIGFDASGVNSKVDTSLRVTGNNKKDIKFIKKTIINKKIEVKQEKILKNKIYLFY